MRFPLYAPTRLWRFAALWALFLPLLLLGQAAASEQFTGKVVGISDGDTLSVLRDGKAVKVRLYGIDTPERRQAFSTAARQFTRCPFHKFAASQAAARLYGLGG